MPRLLDDNRITCLDSLNRDATHGRNAGLIIDKNKSGKGFLVYKCRGCSNYSIKLIRDVSTHDCS